MIVLAVFRLFFIISAVFLLLAFGLAMSLMWKIRLGMRAPFQHGVDPTSRQSFRDGGKIIEGEYKVIEEPKDK